MAKQWNAEETALVLREMQNQTMTNQELAEKLGRSLQSIIAKKRYIEEQRKRIKRGNWTPEEDSALLTAPLKSEDDLARELNREKKEVHERRELLAKKRAEEKQRRAMELLRQAQNKRVPLESYTTELTLAGTAAEQEAEEETAEEAGELTAEMPADASAAEKKLLAIRAAVSMLRAQDAEKPEQALADFLLLADFILADI